METRELGAALNTLYHQWWSRAKPGYYAYRSSMGKRRAVLHSAQRSYLTELEKLEAEIPVWADTQGVPGKREQEMWHRAARIRRAMVNVDPDNVSALLPA